MFLRSLCFLFLLFLGSKGVFAQLKVIVVNPLGDPVPGASVILRSAAGLALERGETSASGSIAFDRSGEWVEVLAEGFERTRENARGRSELKILVSLATIATTIEVSAARDPSIASVESDVGRLAELPSMGLVENLRATPGVNAARRGGTNIEPVVRGLRETQLALIVDGARTFAAGPARMDSGLSHVEPGHIDTVEVIAGPYALTEAAGALGAIIVRSPQVPRFDTWKLGAETSAGWRSNGSGRFGRIRAFGGDRKAGFSLRAAGNKGNDYQAGGRGPVRGITIPGDHSNHQLGGKLRFNPADNQEIALSGFYDEQTGIDYPGRLLNAEHFILRSWKADYSISKPSPLVSSIQFDLYLNKKSHRMSNTEKPTALDMPGRRPPFALEVSLPTESDTFGGSGRIELAPGETVQMRTGFDFYRLKQDARRFLSRRSNGLLLFNDAVWPDASINDQGVYAQVGKRYERGEIDGALRFDFVQADAGRPTEFFLQNAGADLDRKETNANFSLSGRYRVAEGFSLSAGAGRVVRTANSLERFSDRFPSSRFQIAAEFMGSPAIKPEASLQGDIHLEFVKGGFQGNIGGYLRRIDDYITVRADPGLPKRLPLSPPVVFRYFNGDHAAFRGYEFGLRYRGMRGLELRFQGAKTIADDQALNEPVLGIAPLELDSGLRYTPPSGVFWVDYSLRNVFDQRRISVARQETPSPGFSTHDIRFGVRINQQIDLHGGIENLGDKHHFEHLNSLNPFTRQRIPEPGRSFYVGLATRW